MHLGLALGSSWEKSVTVDEAGHVAAGAALWVTGDARLFHQDPPLVRMIATAPFLVLRPEVPLGKPLDARTDLYSLGCSFYFMLTGRPPFPEGTVLQKLLQHQGDDPPDPRIFREDLPPELTSILTKLLTKDPARRFQNPAELIAELGALAESIGLPSTAFTINYRPMAVPGAPSAWLKFQAIYLFCCPREGIYARDHHQRCAIAVAGRHLVVHVFADNRKRVSGGFAVGVLQAKAVADLVQHGPVGVLATADLGRFDHARKAAVEHAERPAVSRGICIMKRGPREFEKPFDIAVGLVDAGDDLIGLAQIRGLAKIEQ
jgi:hypothetical protein